MNKVLFFFLMAFLPAITAVEKVSAGPGDTVSFLHVTDLHLIYHPGLYQEDLASDRRHYAGGVPAFENFLETVPQQTGADFVVATGDVTDYYKGETIDENMLELNIPGFASTLSRSTVPVYATLGNHDIVTYSWNDSSRVSTQSAAGKARAAWISEVPCFREGTYYSREIRVGETVYRLIFLDDAYNTVKKEESIILPFIGREQAQWLDTQFSESDSDVEILMMHIPMYPEKMDLPESGGIYDIVKAHPSLKLVLVGHHHKNEQKLFTTPNGQFTQVQTGAFAINHNNWRLVTLAGDKIVVSSSGNTSAEIHIPVR